MAVDLPTKATPLQAGEPVEAVANSQLGSTFAERRAAREAQSEADPEVKPVEESEAKLVRKPRSRKAAADNA